MGQTSETFGIDLQSDAEQTRLGRLPHFRSQWSRNYGSLLSFLRNPAEQLDIERAGNQWFAVDAVCALEQCLADADLASELCGVPARWRSICDQLRGLAVDLVEGLLGSRTVEYSYIFGKLISVAPKLDEFDSAIEPILRNPPADLNGPLVLGPMWPESMSNFPIDHDLYAHRALEMLAADLSLKTTKLSVVGIRTSGSQLAALWAGAMAFLERRCPYFTIRPLYREQGTQIPLSSIKDQLAGRAIGRILLIDDAVNTGTTLETCKRDLKAQPPEDWDIVTIVHRVVRKRGRDSDIRATALSSSRILTNVGRNPATPEDIANGMAVSLHCRAWAENLELLGWQDVRPTWHRYVESVCGLEDAGILSISKPRYILHLSCGRVFAKYVGFGDVHLDSVLRSVEGRICSPNYVGAACGYLLYRWIDGSPLDFLSGTELTNENLRRMASISAELLMRDHVFDLGPAGVTFLIERALRGVPESNRRSAMAKALNLGLREQTIPLVNAPVNRSHWHWIKTSGSIFRVQREVLNYAGRKIDPLEDLGAVIVEFGLSDLQIAALVTEYEKASGVPISIERLALGIASHARFVESEFARADRFVAWKRVDRQEIASKDQQRFEARRASVKDMRRRAYDMVV